MTRRIGSALGNPGLIRAVRTLLVSLVACSVAGLSPGVTSAQTAEDSVDVRARIEAYRVVWNSHDPSDVAAFFSEGADFVMGNQPAAVGKRAIEDWWRLYFSNQEPERHLALDVQSVRFVAAGVAVVIVVTTTGGHDREGRELLARRFRGTWVVRREGGEWLIAAMRGVPTEQDQVVLNASLAATEELRPEIRAFIGAYEDAFNSRVASAVGAFYSDDAEIVVRNGPVTRGRPAIAGWWQSYFDQAGPYRALFIVKDIQMVTSNVALINIVGAGMTAEATAEPAPVRYTRATWLLAREADDAGWLITALWVLPSEDDEIIRGGQGGGSPEPAGAGN